MFRNKITAGQLRQPRRFRALRAHGGRSPRKLSGLIIIYFIALARQIGIQTSRTTTIFYVILKNTENIAEKCTDNLIYIKKIGLSYLQSVEDTI